MQKKITLKKFLQCRNTLMQMRIKKIKQQINEKGVNSSPWF